MNKALKIVAWLMAFCLGLPIACVLYVSFDARTAAESVGPTNKGSLIIYREEGFLDTTFSLCVRDYAKFGSEPIGVADLTSGGQNDPPRKVVWSADGTLVAVKRDESLIFYDFQNHRNGYRSLDGVAELMKKRGGEGPEFITDEKSFDEVGHHVWWWQSYPNDEDIRISSSR